MLRFMYFEKATDNDPQTAISREARLWGLVRGGKAAVARVK
jgi:hypothetical protein